MEPIPLPAACWDCGGGIDAKDRYCRYCGKGQGAHVAWFYQPWGIAVSALLGLGPFALPLVWRSPRLSPQAKWLWTVALLALTAWAGWLFYQAWLNATRMLSETMSLLGGGGMGL